MGNPRTDVPFLAVGRPFVSAFSAHFSPKSGCTCIVLPRVFPAGGASRRGHFAARYACCRICCSYVNLCTRVALPPQKRTGKRCPSATESGSCRFGRGTVLSARSLSGGKRIAAALLAGERRRRESPSWVRVPEGGTPSAILCILSVGTESMSPKGVLAKSAYLRFRPRAKTTATPLLVLFPKNTISLGVLWGPGTVVPCCPRRNVGTHPRPREKNDTPPG